MISNRAAKPELRTPPAPGYVSAIATVEGIVERLMVAPGNAVGRGQVLLALDARSYRSALVAAEAQVERYRTSLRQANAEIDTLKTAVAADQTKQVSLDLATGRRDDLMDLLRERTASLNAARLALSGTVIRAPACGKVAKILVHVGDMLRVGENSLSIDPSSRCPAGPVAPAD